MVQSTLAASVRPQHLPTRVGEAVLLLGGLLAGGTPAACGGPMYTVAPSLSLYHIQRGTRLTVPPTHVMASDSGRHNTQAVAAYEITGSYFDLEHLNLHAYACLHSQRHVYMH